ncbi:hypothetical protein GGS21DRAFT_176258 [Xylaria nigripes]|nr:hypothetical protein GGS21DRAFT_176258 [Xylaria nigripes]
MTSPIPQCRGFTHPFVLLVRSTLRTRCSPETSLQNTMSSPCVHLANALRQRRYFSSSDTLYNVKPSKPPVASTTKPAYKLSAIGALANPSVSYARRLAMKKQPTVLYEGASQTGFLVSSYGAAFFCFSCSVINSWFNVYNLPPGISSWVPVGFSVISFMFAAIGTIFSLRPSSIIRSIKILPFTTSQQAEPDSANQRVLFEVAARRISPIPLPLKRIQVEPERIIMVNRVQHRPVVLSREALTAKNLEDARRRKEERQYELDHLMTAPFRDAGKASASLFTNLRRGLTGEGFTPVFIDGVKYKMDVEGGYALENGQVLDRLVKIQPDLQLARMQSENQTKK